MQSFDEIIIFLSNLFQTILIWNKIQFMILSVR